jgi:colanic acid biosynthesis glycosyl transferase WcaI
MGFLKSRVLFTPIKWLEAATLKLFDRVSTISPPMMERIMRKGVRPERVILFPNGVNTKAIFPLSKPSVLREELGIAADRIVALYSGTMGAKQGLEDLIEVTREPGLETIQFVLCGEGPARHRLEKMAGGQANIQFLALQSGDRLNELLNLADIHLLPQRADVADFVKPSKLGGMLASGRPVVAWAAPNTQVAQAVNGCGTAVRPGDIKAFAEALRTMAAAPLERRELGEAARRRAVNELERVSILSTFENDLAELTNV